MMTDRMTLPEKVQAKLDHLQRLNYALLIIGAVAIIAFGSFALWELHRVQALTNDLCSSLERAGILIGDPKDSPCDR